MAFWRILVALALLLPATLPGISAEAEAETSHCHDLSGTSVCIAEASYVADVCDAIATYADHFGLPQGFLARLIWQESRFDPQAISPAGAQGIAQFMPGTARLRKLGNPFDPAEALARSAEYLRALESRFGNLGLAAAAYNGGEQRLANFVAGTGGLPGETRAYVSIITGRSADSWLESVDEPVDYALHPEKPFTQACVDMASAVPMPRLDLDMGQWQPWGVLIAQNFSAEIARDAFTRAKDRHADLFAEHQLLLITIRNLSLGTRLRYSAQVGFPSREEAQSFCTMLMGDGGNCLVQRNGS